MNKLWIPLALIIPAVLYLAFRKSESLKQAASTAGAESKNKPAERNQTSARTAAKSKGDVKRSVSQRCKAVTASGKKCARVPLPDSDFCWQHAS